MPNMTLSLPDDLHEEIKAHPEIKWSVVVRQALRKELERLHAFDEMLKDSKLTEADAIELGREIRHAAARRRR